MSMLGAEGGIFLSLRKQPTGLFAAKADVADACRLWSSFQIPPQMKKRNTQKRVPFFGAEGGIFFSLTQHATGMLLPKPSPLRRCLWSSFQIPPQMKNRNTQKRVPVFGAEGGIFLSLRKQPTGLFAAKADVADACRLWSSFQIPPQMKKRNTQKRVPFFGAEGGI